MSTTCVKEIPSQLVLSGSSNQLVIGKPESANYIQLSAATPSAIRTITIPDPGGNCNLVFGASQVVHETATATITAEQSGSVIFVDSAAAAVTLTLPTLQAGLRYKIVVTSSSLANAVTITAPSACMTVTVACGDATAAASTGFSGGTTTAKTNLILGTGSKIGDQFDCVCDGTGYYVSGVIALHTSVTAS